MSKKLWYIPDQHCVNSMILTEYYRVKLGIFLVCEYFVGLRHQGTYYNCNQTIFQCMNIANNTILGAKTR